MKFPRLLFPADMCVSLALATAASAAPITNLFNTGVGNTGVALAAGAQDPHYLITAAAQGPINTGAIVILNHPNWLANSAASSWIGVVNPGSANVNVGNYRFLTTFDLTGLEPSTAQISFKVAVDNDMSDVLINGISTGLSFSGFGGFSSPLTIASGFIEGTNALEFRAINSGATANPAGFRVEFTSGTADLQPPPGTPPTIVTSPLSQNVGLGDSLSLTVSATGSRPFSYQWRFNSAPIPAGTNSTYTIPTVGSSNAGNYDVIVSNTTGAPTSGVAVVTVVFLSAAQRSYEPAGPSTRRGGVAFSEIMYHPTNRTDLRNGEFIELYNSNPFAEDLSGYRISGAVDYTFPNGTSIPGLGYLVVAPVPADVSAIYGIGGVLGGFTNNLPNDSGTIRLRKKSGGVVLEVNYTDQPPWPVAADGTGHSLVLARPSYGENDPQSWAASNVKGGSPGAADPVPSGALENVVINEILAHTDAPLSDYVELHNHSPLSVDVSGAWLSDDATTNKFQIPPSTVLLPGGFVAFDEAQLGFSLGANGETVYFVNPAQTRVLDALRFEGQANGVAFGRWPDGEGAFRELSARTPGTNNAPPLARPIVINEIMYNPISGDDDDQFVELYNRGGSVVNLGGWQFTAGIDYTFPTNTMLAPGGYLVVARNASRMMMNYAGLNAGNLFGNFGGRLSHGGERLALGMPDYSFQTNAQTQVVTSNVSFYVVMNEVTYGDGGRWGQWSDGGGSSLELVDAHSDNRLAPNWGDSDETAKSQWTSFEHTGVLDLGHPNIPSINQLHLFLMDAGEAMVDDLEVISSAANRVSNPGFESGTNGWTFRGTQRTSYSTNGGFSGANALRLVATARGDVVNRVETTLTAVPATNSTVTLRAKARWLRGHPELMLRLIGNSLEAVGRLSVPRNLGTPGAVNSRARANLGPVITEVTHRPVLPQAGQTIRVTARVQDVDGVQGATLVYRVDPSATLNSVPMNDGGTNSDLLAGDGIYTGLVPGQSSGVIVAFRVQATDIFDPMATTQFPEDAPLRECLVRVGESVPAGAFSTYRMWMTQATFDAWSAREKSSNEDSDTTFAYGNYRVIYNVGVHYGSSQNYSTGLDTPTGRLVGYNMAFPGDDLLLGASGVRLDWPNRDTTQLREVTMYWLLEQYGLPNHYRRFIHLHINGVRRATIYNDSQRPNADSISEWYPDDTEGELFKLNPWFEANTNGAILTSTYIPPRLTNITTTGGVTKTAYYRYAWLPRAVNGSVNNYSNLFAMIAAANAPTDGYQSAVACVIDIPQWMRTFAMNDLASYWDAFGNPNYKNSYLYLPDHSGWKVMCWDFDVGLGTGNGGGQVQEKPTAALFDTGDLALQRMNATPFIVRHYWAALDEAVYSFFQPAAVQTFLADRYAAFQAAGIDTVSPFVPSGTVPTGEPQRSIPDWITARRDFLLTQLSTVSNVFNVTGPNYITTGTNLVTLTGTAPVRVETITVNGVAYTPVWTTVNAWRLQVPVSSGTNNLVIAGLDRSGNILSNRTVIVEFIGPDQNPADFIVINEIMYNPTISEASYVELFNRSTNYSFDLSGWRLNGIDFTFPPGTIISSGHYLVVAKNRTTFGGTYGWHIPVFCEFDGQLDDGGETLSLIKPGATPAQDMVVSRVTYEDDVPWPAAADGGGTSLQLIDAAQDNARVSNWAAGSATPGQTNAVAGIVPAYPLLWINEVQPNNPDGYRDNTGSPQPWIELFNSGSNALSLDGLSFATSYTNLGQWAFPAGRVIAPGGFLVVFADGHPELTTGAVLHTSFLLNPASGSVVLSRGGQILDYINYTDMQAGFAHGSWPDGQLFDRQNFYIPTPGASNNPTAVPIVLNEWMASNTRTQADPATGRYEDWFELFNYGPAPLDLSGYYLTDDLGNWNKWRIPPGTTLASQSYLLCWADNDATPGGTNTTGNALHTSFQLDKKGEALGFFDPAGLQVDAITFGAQTSDVSEGRFPNGSASIIAMTNATPGRENRLVANEPPVLAMIGDKFINAGLLLTFTVLATDPDLPAQTLNFTLDPGAPEGAAIDPASGVFTWTPTVAQAPAAYPVTVRVTDSASVSMSATQTITITVTLGAANNPPILASVLNRTLNESALLLITNTATDADPGPQTLAFSLDAPVPDGMSIDSASGLITWTPAEVQGPGTYPVTVRVTDNGTPPLHDVKTFTIIVNEVNTAPQLSFPSNWVVHAGELVTFTAAATDADVPSQILTFSLEAGAPVGAAIEPASGLFTWTPPDAAGGTNIITLRVTDRGLPAAHTSLPLTVVVISAPPSSAIITPTNPVVAVNSNLTLRATAVAGGQLFHQWQLNGTNLSGASTGSTFTLVAARLADAGPYSVIVSNLGGAITSAPVNLRVLTPPAFTLQPQSQSVWVGSNATFQVTVNGDGPIFMQWRFNGTNLPNATNATLTITNVNPNHAGSYQVRATNIAAVTLSDVATLIVHVPLAITAQPQSQSVFPYTNVAFTVGVSGSQPIGYQWRFNTNSVLAGATNATLQLTSVLPTNSGTYTVIITNTISAVTSAPAVLLAYSNPIILTQPIGRSAALGSNAAFNVVAVSSSLLRYQWYFNTNTALPNATNDTHTVLNVQTTNYGFYNVRVWDAFGSVWSEPAQMADKLKPAIVQQPTPASGAGFLGSNYSITVSAYGPQPLTYNLRKNGNVFLTQTLNDTNCTFTLTNLVFTNCGSYEVIVTNVAGNAPNSSRAYLTVMDPLTNRFAWPGSNVTFSFQAASLMPNSTISSNNFLKYQWWFNETNLVSTVTNLKTTVTNIVLNLTNVQAAQEGRYTVVLTNANGLVTTQSATLTILRPPVITSQPASQSLPAGSDAAFSVTAGGTAPLSYQWWHNQTNFLAGSAAPTLTLTSVQPGQAGGYRVIITNSVGSVTSDVATLTITITEPPRFDAVVAPPMPGGPLEFGFMGQADQSYSVLWREHLAVGTWEVLTNIPTLGSSQPVLIQDETAGRAQRFYRIVTPMQP